jgi:hypothetical protein
MAGGDSLKSLKMTFVPDFLSMNLLMVGMLLVSKFWMPATWFIMTMTLTGLDGWA